MHKKVENRLKALYATLPKIECQGKCQESCGPIIMERGEYQRIVGRPDVQLSKCSLDNLICPLLKDGKCSVYELRPAICRLWGVVESMQCTFGCKPSRYLTHREGHKFLAEVAKIAGRKNEKYGTLPDVPELDHRQTIEQALQSANSRSAAEIIGAAALLNNKQLKI